MCFSTLETSHVISILTSLDSSMPVVFVLVQLLDKTQFNICSFYANDSTRMYAPAEIIALKKHRWVSYHCIIKNHIHKCSSSKNRELEQSHSLYIISYAVIRIPRQEFLCTVYYADYEDREEQRGTKNDQIVMRNEKRIDAVTV